MRRVALVLASLALLGGLWAGSPASSAVPEARSGPALAADSTLGDLTSRFLTTRPTVGPTWVVDLGPEGTARRLTLRSLQGIVNRTQARLYLLDPGDGGATGWLSEYQSRGLVTVAGTLSGDAALDQFAGEARGYVLATESEPWTLNVAATIAAAEGGIVATPEQVIGLEARGLTRIEDVRGRWTDAATAYEDLVAGYRSRMASPSIAVLRPTDALYDFTAQQGILTLFTRPNDPDWPRIAALLTATPAGSIVYGYLSDTGDEEAVAVATLSSADLNLVATDTSRNLSFHVAVGADRARATAARPDTSGIAPCQADTLNVVVGLTDGDNMAVPLSHFPRPSNWDSPRRGTFPLGWSIGPELAILAPTVWDTYAREASAADELVAMIGYAYSAPALLSDPASFYADSFGLMDELGMRTFWSLGGGLDLAAAPQWATFDTAAGAGVPDGVLVGYGNATGAAFHSPAGRPAFTSRSVYGETPADLVGHIRSLQATPPADRPIVSFLAATNWTNPADTLIAALAPLEAEGVRFLTPAEATACMPPPAPPAPPPAAGARTCAPGDPLTRSGLSLISAPVADEITARPTPFTLPVTVQATPAVAAGDTIEYSATVEVDLDAFAADTLTDRVRPVVEAGYGPVLADSAWVGMTFRGLTLTFPRPITTTPTSTPTATSTGPSVTATTTAEGLALSIGDVDVDTRTPGAPFTVTARWTARATGGPAPSSVELVDGPIRFDLAITVGVLLGQTPLAGTVRAPWTCIPAGAVLAATTVGAAPPPADPPGPPPSTPTDRPVPAAAPATAVPAAPDTVG